jgi:N-carbamoylputrescine amidase
MPSNINYRIGVVQMSCTPDPEENLEKAAAMVRDAARQGANVVCLPELFRAQYFCQREDTELFNLAEPIPGPSTERLGAVAREEKVTIIASLFERRAAGLYHNTAATLGTDGSILGLYRKMHIPDDPLYYEKYYFTPGDLGYRALDTSVGKIGTLVCWDQWYPEGARITALQGANVLFYPTAIGWHPYEKEQRSTTPGRRSSARTRSRTVSTSPRRTAWGWSMAMCAATASTGLDYSFGAARLSPTRLGG